LITIISASSSGVDIKEDDEAVSQEIVSVALQDDVPLRDLPRNKFTIKVVWLAIEVQDKANSLQALENVVQTM
jgi:hypothetical protein